jgi:NAD(P)-dependent dehydrogenase (short-subunit alcohol dehydrogenase family)
MHAMLDGKVALITGAGNGIGAAGAALFAAEGASVFVVDIDGDAADEVATTIEKDGGTAWAATVDVRDPDQVTGLRDRVLTEQGRLDVLVNNVGHWVRLPPSFADSDAEQWQALYEVNLLQLLRVTHTFLPSMLERRAGTIINVSSIEGLRGYPPDSVYAALKAAVVQFTRSLGVEVAGKGVKVNGIAPDLTQTKQSDFLRFDPPELADKWATFLPVGRMGEPLDQARVLLFLASELSDFLVGHTVPTDGGTAAAGGWFPSQRRKGRSWTNRPFDP